MITNDELEKQVILALKIYLEASYLKTNFNRNVIINDYYNHGSNYQTNCSPHH